MLSGELPPHGGRSFRLAPPTHLAPVPFPHSFFSFRGDVLAVAVWPDAIPRLKADPPGSYSRHMRSERRQRAQRPSLRSGFRHVADSKQRSDQRERHGKKKVSALFSSYHSPLIWFRTVLICIAPPPLVDILVELVKAYTVHQSCQLHCRWLVGALMLKKRCEKDKPQPARPNLLLLQVLGLAGASLHVVPRLPTPFAEPAVFVGSLGGRGRCALLFGGLGGLGRLCLCERVHTNRLRPCQDA